MKKAMVVSVGLALMGSLVLCGNALADQGKFKHSYLSKRKAKNVILMVPDGMGLSDVTAARVFKSGPDGEPLSFEKLPVIGYQRTHSANSLVTDSAAAAGAWATGEKFANGEVSCHSEGGTSCVESPKTILEIAKAKGKATGLIATSDVTHATPAVFAAHMFSRNCEAAIGQQMLNSGVDVILGGGIDSNKDGLGCPVVEASEVIASAPGLGYTVVETLQDLNNAVDGGSEKILGLFKLKGKTPENFWIDANVGYPVEEPTLYEMTAAALDVLEKDRDGFFLMVEGSQIDWANHGNRYGIDENIDPNSDNTQLGEMLAFDAAVETVMSWVNSNRRRKNSTLVIVVSDHETGGFHINGPYGEQAQQGDLIEDGWTTGGHTAQDTVIWSQGPGSFALGRAIDNTDVFYIMKKYMR